MRRILVLGLLWMAGCQSVSGPLMPRSPERPDDPAYSIKEQEARGRNRWALPDDSDRVAPPSGFPPPKR